MLTGHCGRGARTLASPSTLRRSLRRAVAQTRRDRESSVKRHLVDCPLRLDGRRHRSKHRKPTLSDGRYQGIGRKLFRRFDRRAQHAVRRIRPANTKRLSHDSVLATGGNQQLDIAGMRVGLRRRNESRPHPHRRRTQRQDTRHPFGRADTTSRHHRHLNCRQHLQQHLLQRLDTTNMPARLDPLSNHIITARPNRRLRLADRPDLPARDCTTALHISDQVTIRITEKELHHLNQTRRSHHRRATDKRHQKPDAKRRTGNAPRHAHKPRNICGRRIRNHPQTTRQRHRRRQLRRPNRTAQRRQLQRHLATHKLTKPRSTITPSDPTPNRPGPSDISACLPGIEWGCLSHH